MTNPIGPYWAVMHRRQSDYAYFKALQPSVFKIMDGGPPDYQFARDHLPNSLVVARDWALSEQHEDMLKDPVATGRRHTQEWNAHQQRLGFVKSNTLILGINEPKVWDAGVTEALRRYTIAMCEEATTYGLRVGAMQLSVGWPNNTGPDTPPHWEPFHGVDNAIRANHGALVLHEYWADNGPDENWGWWAGRSLKCPWDVPIVIGECGIDMYVKDGSVPHATRGWRGRKSPEQYAAELSHYAHRMVQDKRFLGCCVFLSDFANREWASFDLEPAYNAVLAQPVAQHTVHIPVVGTGPTAPAAVGFIGTPAGANLRQSPIDGKVITAVPYGEQVAIVGVSDQNGWVKVRYGQHEGWMATHLITLNQPAPDDTPQQPPTTTPAGDTWARSLQWILKWEGGWADNPNDPGGATMKGITIGTYTRWRQAHGQPTPTKADLRNISDAEVAQIYREWYWNESGANRLSWPLCLAVFNIAVNAGPSRAQQFMGQSNGNFLLFMATAMDWYTKIDGWKHFGAAWTRRNADLLREASK